MADELTLDIYKISRCTHNYYARELKKLGITMGQFPFLIGIAENDGISQERLSTNLRISKSTTATIIRQLMDAGLVSRETDETDRRNFKLHAKPEAHTLVPKIYSAIEKCHTMICRSISESERERFTKILAKIRADAENNLSKSSGRVKKI